MSVTETNDVGDFINVTEAAEMFGVHPVTIRSWIRNGVIPAAKLPNGQIRLSKTWCETRLAEMRAQAHG